MADDECCVCLESRLEFVEFDVCGHRVCTICYPRILQHGKCHICRAVLVNDPPPVRRDAAMRRPILALERRQFYGIRGEEYRILIERQSHRIAFVIGLLVLLFSMSLVSLVMAIHSDARIHGITRECFILNSTHTVCGATIHRHYSIDDVGPTGPIGMCSKNI